MTTAMTIKCCAECPFFERVPVLSALSEMLAEPGKDSLKGSLANAGTCNFDRDTNTVIRVRVGVVGTERDKMLADAKKRLVVVDRNGIPEKCPLRERDIVVTLGS